MDAFLSLVAANGLEGMLAGAFVLVLVYLLGQAGVAPSGNQKRVANVVLSIFLSGLSLFEPQPDDALVAAMASVGSALAYEFIRFLAAQAAKAKK